MNSCRESLYPIARFYNNDKNKNDKNQIFSNSLNLCLRLFSVVHHLMSFQLEPLS